MIHTGVPSWKVSLDGVRVFPVGPFQAFVSLGNTSFFRSEGRYLAPRLLFFLITYLGIEVTSRLFCLNSGGLCVGFHISSTAPTDYTSFPVGIAVRLLSLVEWSQSSKISALFK